MRSRPAALRLSSALLSASLLGVPLQAAPGIGQLRSDPGERSAATGAEAASARRGEAEASQASPLAVLPLSGGLLLYFDPERGTLVERPTPAQRAALQKAIRGDRAGRAALLHESSRGLRTFAVPGGVGVALEGRYTHALVLRLQPDGSAEIDCSDDLPTKQELEPTAPVIEKQ